jgi:4-hydroxy-tetrahydrodipicolinate synthase
MTPYKKTDAKAYARAHFKGVWAATITPFLPDTLAFDEAGYIRNVRHWFYDLKIAGLFTCGKQGEFFSMSVAERKRCLELTIAIAKEHPAKPGVVMSCSDTNLDVVLDLAKTSQAMGAHYIVVHSPVLHFGADTDDTIYEYYRYLSERLDIGIALWNHPDCGYIMSPQLCARIAKLPNIVAIKYSTERALYVELTHLAGDDILVSNPSEEDWLDNIRELNWQLYLCSTPPILLQTKADTRIHDYTQAAFASDFKRAQSIKDSLEPARAAFKQARLSSGPTPTSKIWQECLGQVGGSVRRPLVDFDAQQRRQVEQFFAQSGLSAKAQRSEK